MVEVNTLEPRDALDLLGCTSVEKVIASRSKPRLTGILLQNWRTINSLTVYLLLT